MLCTVYGRGPGVPRTDGTVIGMLTLAHAACIIRNTTPAVALVDLAVNNPCRMPWPNSPRGAHGKICRGNFAASQPDRISHPVSVLYTRGGPLCWTTCRCSAQLRAAFARCLSSPVCTRRHCMAPLRSHRPSGCGATRRRRRAREGLP